MHRARHGNKDRAFMLSLGSKCTPNVHMFSNPEALPTLCFWVFMEVLLCRHNLLNHWLWVVELNFQPPSIPRGQSWNQNFQPSKHLVGSPGNQPSILGVFPQPPHQYNKRHFYCSYHLRNSRGFKGVPIAAQQKQIPLVSMRMQIGSLASLSGLRIWHCCELECRSQTLFWYRIAVAVV